MRQEEFPAFKSEIKQLCASLGKGYSDALGQAYWRVLKDVPLSEVEANVERILLSATKETKFPRPAELRNDKPRSPARPACSDPDFVRMEEASARCWDERLRGDDPDLARIDLKIAKTDRIVAVEHMGSPIYAAALEENHRYRAERQRLLDSRRRPAAP